MLKVDKDAVICDFAETYHIYNIWELPLKNVATLACGLGNNSELGIDGETGIDNHDLVADRRCPKG